MAPLPARRTTAKVALAAAVLGVGAAALRGRLARFEVAEESMAPTLQPGDYLFAAMTSAPERGDVVVYPDPAQPARDLVKRVIGLPEETVRIEAGQVAIDGAVLAEPWADGPVSPEGAWRVPPGTVFTLGDNRSWSAGDSRATGPVRIAGMYRVTWRYWPLTSLGPV